MGHIARLFFLGAVLLLVAAAAVGGTSIRRGAPAYASGDEPTIRLGAIVVDTLIEAPLDQAPSGLHLGYGLVDLMRTDHLVAAVFDDLYLRPSTESQEYFAYVDTDADAAVVASNLINTHLSDSESFQVIFWFGEPLTSNVYETARQLHVAAGARVQYFKMTVAPFTIEKRKVTNILGQSESDYRMITDGPVAVIEAYGSPPTGDANCNAVPNSIDAQLVLQRGAGLLSSLACEKAADVNGDGSIDALDAQLILQFVAGLIAEP